MDTWPIRQRLLRSARMKPTTAPTTFTLCNPLHEPQKLTAAGSSELPPRFRFQEGGDAITRRCHSAPKSREIPRMKRQALFALILSGASTLLVSNSAAQDASAGKSSFNKCLACH